MGKRSWRLVCQECDNEFWEWFEHMDSESLVQFAQSTKCPECESRNWVMGDKTRFAGGRLQESNRVLTKCKECYGECWTTVGNLSPDEIEETAKELVCAECSSENVSIGDAIPKSYNIDT